VAGGYGSFIKEDIERWLLQIYSFYDETHVSTAEVGALVEIGPS